MSGISWGLGYLKQVSGKATGGGAILSCKTDCKVLRLGYKRGDLPLEKGVHFFESWEIL